MVSMSWFSLAASRTFLLALCLRFSWVILRNIRFIADCTLSRGL